MNDAFPTGDDAFPTGGPPPAASDDSPPEPQSPEPQSPEPQSPEPQFGMIDIVESFTALRHEARTQTLESRQLAGTLQQTTSQIVALERRLLAATDRVQQVADQISSDVELRRLAETIADIDHHVSRAIESIKRLTPEPVDTAKTFDVDGLQHSIRQRFAQQGPIARWFAKTFLQDVQDVVQQWVGTHIQPASDREDPVQQGLDMLMQRIRRLMVQQQIERIDTVGLPFDGQQMHAVDAIESPAHASGHVAQQIHPAYTFRGTLIKFADVRVAK